MYNFVILVVITNIIACHSQRLCSKSDEASSINPTSKKRQKQERRGQGSSSWAAETCMYRERMAFPCTKNQDYGACKGQQKHKAKTMYMYEYM